MNREALIEKQMNLLHCSYAEAEELVNDDLTIDKGGRCDWEPSIEEEREMRKRSKLVVDRKKPASPAKREKKENLPKRELITLLAEALSNADIAISVTNAERMIAFEYAGEKFEVTLIQKRK